jgi:hypothetical protein
MKIALLEVMTGDHGGRRRRGIYLVTRPILPCPKRQNAALSAQPLGLLSKLDTQNKMTETNCKDRLACVQSAEREGDLHPSIFSHAFAASDLSA